MSTIETLSLGTAERMSGVPRTESGEAMPLATWYELSCLDGSHGHVVVTSFGVYQCNSSGRIHDFFTCLHERRAVESHADALRHIGFELSGASA